MQYDLYKLYLYIHISLKLKSSRNGIRLIVNIPNISCIQLLGWNQLMLCIHYRNMWEYFVVHAFLSMIYHTTNNLPILEKIPVHVTLSFWLHVLITVQFILYNIYTVYCIIYSMYCIVYQKSEKALWRIT